MVSYQFFSAWFFWFIAGGSIFWNKWNFSVSSHFNDAWIFQERLSDKLLNKLQIISSFFSKINFLPTLHTNILLIRNIFQDVNLNLSQEIFLTKKWHLTSSYILSINVKVYSNSVSSSVFFIFDLFIASLFCGVNIFQNFFYFSRDIWFHAFLKIRNNILNEAKFFIRCSLLFTRYSLLFTRYSLLFTRYSLLFIRYSLHFTGHTLLFTPYFLLVTCCYLLVTRC